MSDGDTLTLLRIFFFFSLIIQLISLTTFHFVKFSFKHFLTISQTFRMICRVWLIFLADTDLDEQPIFPIWMNNPSLKSYYVVVFKDYAFYYFSCNFFAEVSSFLFISRKIRHLALLNHVQPHLMFLVYLLVTNGLSVCRSLKKIKNEGSTMFRGSTVQKLEEKCFSVKI